MPIKGYSEPKRIPRVGKIYLGEKKSNSQGKEYPTATDHFVVRSDEMNTSVASAQAFHAVYGEQSKEITVAFPSDDPEKFMPQYLASYRGGGTRSELWCKGDGESASRANGTGGYVDIPCYYKECPIFQEGKCKELTRLLFLLPEVEGIGIWELDTTSYHSSQNLLGSIELIRKLTRGKIAMIPLKLRLVPKVVNPDGKTKTVYIVDLKLENIKIMDLLNRIPQLGVEEPMQLIEPFDLDEMPDDLYIERNLVTEDDIHLTSVGHSTEPIRPTSQPRTPHSANTEVRPSPAETKGNSRTLKIVREQDLVDLSNVGAIADIDIQQYKGRDLAKLTISMAETGQMVNTVTDKADLVNSIRTLTTGTLVQFYFVKKENLSMPILQDLAIVS